jgi:hypothetical protein
MKKILFSVLIIFSLGLIGCTNRSITDDQIIESFKNVSADIDKLNNRLDDLTTFVGGDSGLRWVELGNNIEQLNNEDINSRIEKLEEDLYGWSGVGGMQGDIKDIYKSIYDLEDRINKLEYPGMYK